MKKIYRIIIVALISLTLIGNYEYLENTVIAKKLLNQISSIGNNNGNQFFEDFSNYSLNDWQYTIHTEGNDLFVINANPATYEGSGRNTPHLISSNIPESLKTGINVSIYGRIRTNAQEVIERAGYIILYDSDNFLHEFGVGVGSLGPHVRATYLNNTEGIFINSISWDINKWIWLKLISYRVGSFRTFEFYYNLDHGNETKPESWTRDATFDIVIPWRNLKRIGVAAIHWSINPNIQKWEFDDLQIIDETSPPETSTSETSPPELPISLLTTYDINYLFIFSIILVLIKRRKFK